MRVGSMSSWPDGSASSSSPSTTSTSAISSSCVGSKAASRSAICLRRWSTGLRALQHCAMGEHKLVRGVAR